MEKNIKRRRAGDRLKKVAEVIRGFETPYGLELLSTVHWTVKHENKKEESEIIEAIQEWNKRKRNLFLPHHIQKALKHLKNRKMGVTGIKNRTCSVGDISCDSQVNKYVIHKNADIEPIQVNTESRHGKKKINRVGVVFPTPFSYYAG